jgi:chitinase
MTSVELASSDIPKAKVINAKSIKKWSQARVYSTKGARVVSEGFVYQSKYWSQGDKPEKYNANSSWLYMGLADSTQNVDTPESDKGVKAPTKEEVKKKVLTKINPIVIADDDVGTTASYDPVEKKTVITENNPKKEEDKTKVVVGDKFFMPFVDVTLLPSYNFQDGMNNGIKNFVLAFVNSAGTCSPRWGNYSAYTIENTTLNLPEKIKTITEKGGNVMISFGGATAHGNELAAVCTNVDDLAAAYQEVIDKTGVKMLDFDIEGDNSYDRVRVVRRMQALKKIQDANTDVELSFTLATMPSGLVAQSGIMIVKAAIKAGIKFKAINLMLMDYGTDFPANEKSKTKMADYSILALESVNAQLHVLLDGKEGYEKVNNQFYNLLGAIPMIGKNDTPTEFFYKNDATKLKNWCDTNGVRMTSMWSLNRDKPIATGESSSSFLFKSTKLGIDDYGTGKYEFSKLLKRGNAQ